MKKTMRMASFLLALMMLLSLGSAALAAKDISGRYNATGCWQDGEEVSYEGEYFVLNDDGTGHYMLGDSLYEFEWELDGDDFSFVDDTDDTFIGTYDDGVITGTYFADYEYEFTLGESSIAGYYEAIACWLDGEEVSYEGEYFYLDDDGIGYYMLGDSQYDFEWELDGDRFFFEDVGGDTFEGVYENGFITGEYFAGYEYLFVCTGSYEPVFDGDDGDYSDPDSAPLSGDSGVSYVIGEYPVAVTLPEDMAVVLTRDVNDNTPGLDLLEMTAEEALELLETAGNYLDAVSPYTEWELMLTIMEDADLGNGTLEEFIAELSNDEVAEFFDEFAESFAVGLENAGAEISNLEWDTTEINERTWLLVALTADSPDMYSDIASFGTMEEGIWYQFSFKSLNCVMDDATLDEIVSIMMSVAIGDEVTAAPAVPEEPAEPETFDEAMDMAMDMVMEDEEMAAAMDSVGMTGEDLGGLVKLGIAVVIVVTLVFVALVVLVIVLVVRGSKRKAAQRAAVSVQPGPNYTQPGTGYTQPDVGYTTPNAGYTQPNEGYTQPVSPVAYEPRTPVEEPAPKTELSEVLEEAEDAADSILYGATHDWSTDTVDFDEDTEE